MLNCSVRFWIQEVAVNVSVSFSSYCECWGRRELAPTLSVTKWEQKNHFSAVYWATWSPCYTKVIRYHCKNFRPRSSSSAERLLLCGGRAFQVTSPSQTDHKLRPLNCHIVITTLPFLSYSTQDLEISNWELLQHLLLNLCDMEPHAVVYVVSILSHIGPKSVEFYPVHESQFYLQEPPR